MLARFVLAAAAAFLSIAPAEDFTQWAHYRDVTVNTAGITADLAHFPLLVRLGASEADVFALSLAHGADLRFADKSGAALPYHVEQWDSAGKQAAVWVSADLKGNSSVTLRLYWGKAGAPDLSKGPPVFSSAAGYLSVWHLNSSLADAAGTSPDAVNHGSADAAGVVGRGRSFNGTDAWLYLGNAAGLNAKGVVTLEAWARWLNGGISGTMGRRHILTHGIGTVGLKNETALRLLQDKYFAGSYDGTTKAEAAATSPIAGDSAAWVHLAGVYDGTTWRLYRNGAEVATKAHAQGALASDTGWFLGSWGGSARYFSGDIDEARISGVPRGADWIKFEYASQKSGQTVTTLGPTQNGASAVAPAAPSRAFTFTAPGAALSFGFGATEGNLKATVSDLSGRVLWSAPAQGPEIRWDGTASGRAAPAGRYLLRLELAGRAVRQEAFTLSP
jgi:hypothetical protein